MENHELMGSVTSLLLVQENYLSQPWKRHTVLSLHKTVVLLARRQRRAAAQLLA